MATIISKTDKEKALLAHKQKLLNDIDTCKKRIEEVRSAKSQVLYDDESSDSDTGLPTSLQLCGPSTTQLKLQREQMSIRVQATQELAHLKVLQSEVNFVVDVDKLDIGEPKPTEDGIWKEVLADCKVDLISFSILVFVFQPNRKFAATSYHSLKVTPVKVAHAKELAKSTLGCVKRPSDAVQVIRSYAAVHRSRRTTLADLAERYTDGLYMETMEEGGFLLKFAKVLEIRWTLQNRWSPLASFQHRMKFDLEYMDELYIKAIEREHRKLSDADLQTDERTKILSKIFEICLEAHGPISDIQESDTDHESIPKPNQRRATLDQEPIALDRGSGKRKLTNSERPQEDIDTRKTSNNDAEIMAPPKNIPRKSKATSVGIKTAPESVSKKIKRSMADGACKDDAVKSQDDKLEPANKKNKVLHITDANDNMSNHKVKDVSEQNELAGVEKENSIKKKAVSDSRNQKENDPNRIKDDERKSGKRKLEEKHSQKEIKEVTNSNQSAKNLNKAEINANKATKDHNNADNVRNNEKSANNVKSSQKTAQNIVESAKLSKDVAAKTIDKPKRKDSDSKSNDADGCNKKTKSIEKNRKVVTEEQDKASNNEKVKIHDEVQDKNTKDINKKNKPNTKDKSKESEPKNPEPVNKKTKVVEKPAKTKEKNNEDVNEKHNNGEDKNIKHTKGNTKTKADAILNNENNKDLDKPKTVASKKTHTKSEEVSNTQKSVAKLQSTDAKHKHVGNIKQKTVEKHSESQISQKTKRPNVIGQKSSKVFTKIPMKNGSKPLRLSNSPNIISNVYSKVSTVKSSKIPQKLSTIREPNKNVFRNPLQITPKKQMASSGFVKPKHLSVGVRNSPRTKNRDITS